MPTLGNGGTLETGFARRRIRTLLQAEVGECGLTCLAMVARFYGSDVDLPTLRRHCRALGQGATLAMLVDAADRLSLAARPLRVELADLRSLSVPCILHLDFRHFVVLERISRRAAIIHDPAEGRRKVRPAELSSRFTGIAVELTPSERFSIRPPRPSAPLGKLFGRFSGLRRLLAQMLLVALALEILALASPLFLQWVVDQAIVSADRDLLAIMALAFLLLLVVQTGLGAARSWLALRAAADFGLRWLQSVFAHLVRLPLAYFEQRHPADVASRLFSAQTIQQALTGGLVEGIVDGALAGIALAMMITYRVDLALVAVAATVLYCVARALGHASHRRESTRQLASAARQQTILLETVAGIAAIKTADGEARAVGRWVSASAQTVAHAVALQRLAIGLRAAQVGLFGGEQIIAIWLGGLLVMDGRMTVGMLLAFLAYRTLFGQRVAALVDRVGELAAIRANAERLSDIVDEPVAESASNFRAFAARAVEPSVELVGVGVVGYGGRTRILDDVSVGIEAGRCLAVVGESGAGKTTLLKVVLGLLRPDEGSVRVGGVEIDRLDRGELRACFAAVLQGDRLLTGTVAENISGFDPEPDEQWIAECAALAAIDGEIRRLPVGYDTPLTPAGSVLSGGQVQRLLIAKMLYRRPKILILDEATSQLDATMVRRVDDAIRALGLTRIVVAHRAEAIASADRIVRLECGRIRPAPAGLDRAAAAPAGAR